MSNKVVISVSGGAGQIAYSLLPRLAKGELTGDARITLKLLEIPPILKALEGVRMELEDLASPYLERVVCTSDNEEAFGDSNFVFLLGGKPRGKGMERKDLIRDNGPIFTSQGSAIGKAAAKDVRILVVANPCNTNCLIAAHNAPNIPKDRWAAMMRLDHNRAASQLAMKAGTSVDKVTHVTIWGNHSATQYPDTEHALVSGKPAREGIKDRAWLDKEFVGIVQQRGKAIIDARGVSSATSAASAAIDHMKEWVHGTPKGDWTSSAVWSDGSYGVPEGLYSGFPVTYDAKGAFQIVKDLKHDENGQAMLKATIAELLDERDTVKDLLKG
jgi:malate dehydrogenase